MMASLPADQEIDQAIERLQKKMQAVSDNLDRGRNYKKSSQKRVKGKSRQEKSKSSLKRLLKYLFIFILLGATSFVVAQIAKGYIKNLANVDSTETAETKSNEVHSQQPIADISQAADKAPPPAPAKFSMQAANYNIVESELGPVLDIAITVANIGEEAGRPKLFEIELVDDSNKQLMKWPMAASGASISPQQEMVYKTRLIEPPADFKNIRVTMKK